LGGANRPLKISGALMEVMQQKPAEQAAGYTDR